MGKEAFEEFLTSHGEPEGASVFDWQTQKEEWLAFIDRFYSDLKRWFQPYLDRGQLDYHFQPFELTEDSIGTYQARKMLVQFAGQKLQMTPVGTMLIGTRGRIDMEGARGVVWFILQDQNKQRASKVISFDESENGIPRPKPAWEWMIAVKGSGKLSFVNFNEENFFEALMEVVDG